MLQLVIGNKNYSSWSMRPWVLMTQLEIPFTEIQLGFDFDGFTPDSPFKQTLANYTQAGRVPVLLDGDLAIWDTLSIVAYLHELYPDAGILPQDRVQRALARSACAEMHAGFSALRSHCLMNIEAQLAETGALIWRDQPAVRADVARLVQLWQHLDNHAERQTTDTLGHGHQGGLLGAFCVVDAYFAPVCTRIKTYQLPVPDAIQTYVDWVLAQQGVQAWVQAALQEAQFLPFEEPYRLHR